MEKALSHLQKMDLDFHPYTGKVIPPPLEAISLPAARNRETEVPCL